MYITIYRRPHLPNIVCTTYLTAELIKHVLPVYDLGIQIRGTFWFSIYTHTHMHPPIFSCFLWLLTIWLWYILSVAVPLQRTSSSSPDGKNSRCGTWHRALVRNVVTQWQNGWRHSWFGSWTRRLRSQHVMFLDHTQLLFDTMVLSCLAEAVHQPYIDRAGGFNVRYMRRVPWIVRLPLALGLGPPSLSHLVNHRSGALMLSWKPPTLDAYRPHQHCLIYPTHDICIYV